MANYFAIFLVAMTAITGLIWLIDAVFFAGKRKAAAIAERQAIVGNDVSVKLVGEEADPHMPVLVDNAKQFFPIFALVMVFRSFLYEPFQIPSGSMMPTLLVGDFILVEKFSYGIKDPIFRSKLVETGSPERGDVVVFKFPEDPSLDYIKRVIGLPGDKVVYRDKKVYLTKACEGQSPCPSEELVPQEFVGQTNYIARRKFLMEFNEGEGDKKHGILVDPGHPAEVGRYYKQPGTMMDEYIVPEGEYFVMGDNRDNSEDGRYWGFVPEHNLVGKAVLIWVSFEFDRQPEDFLPTWVPSGIRFERSGGIQ
ncbi:signal peptidase I [Glaciecola sp. MH2013]|uniref:signal peptidase I n=1 Tax=Glaciecola sp. MH2013 TaxID=2785524 RepID=UPI00189E455E|nr:signal peptidase I [Glaciecola sp. MH2013]MBF7074727.1 signal peptidase I [Glaciecola sp. MH2013]